MPVGMLPLPSPNFPLTDLDGTKLCCDTDFLSNKAHASENPSEMWILELKPMTKQRPSRRNGVSVPASCYQFQLSNTTHLHPLVNLVGDKPAEGDS